MIGRVAFSSALVAVVFAMPHAAVADSARQVFAHAAGQVTAADAAPFVGDWTLALQGPNGPGTFELSVKVEKEKVSGEISSELLPKQPSVKSRSRTRA